MSTNRIEITCIRCGHTWYEDLAHLDKEDQVIYKGVLKQATYRVSCPQCDTNNVVTVKFKETQDV